VSRTRDQSAPAPCSAHANFLGALAWGSFGSVGQSATHVAQVRSHHTTSHARCQLALASATSLPALAIVDCDYRGPYQCAPQTLAQDLLCCCQHDGRQVHARLPLSYAEKVVSRIWDLSAPAPCSAHAKFPHALACGSFGSVGQPVTLAAQVPSHQTTSRAPCQFALASRTRLPALAKVECDYRGPYQCAQ